MDTPSTSVGARLQQNNMTASAKMTLDADLDFLSLKEVAEVLRVAPISVYRLIAKQALPVYRTCRKILFKKTDVLGYLASRRHEPPQYGGSQN